MSDKTRFLDYDGMKVEMVTDHYSVLRTYDEKEKFNHTTLLLVPPEELIDVRVKLMKDGGLLWLDDYSGDRPIWQKVTSQCACQVIGESPQKKLIVKWGYWTVKMSDIELQDHEIHKIAGE